MTTVRARMTHRALVERDEASGVDAYNNPTPPDWQTLTAAQPCFLVTRSGREAVSPDRIVVVDDIALLVPKGADITARDRVNGISDRLGNVLLDGILDVEDVLPHHDHVELELRRVS